MGADTMNSEVATSHPTTSQDTIKKKLSRFYVLVDVANATGDYSSS